jgi:hypothetical protein
MHAPQTKLAALWGTGVPLGEGTEGASKGLACTSFQPHAHTRRLPDAGVLSDSAEDRESVLDALCRPPAPGNSSITEG